MKRKAILMHYFYIIKAGKIGGCVVE
jgi:hypothetical protein